MKFPLELLAARRAAVEIKDAHSRAADGARSGDDAIIGRGAADRTKIHNSKWVLTGTGGNQSE